MKRFKNLVVSSRQEWESLGDEVKKLKNEIQQVIRKNAELRSKLDAYETGCLYGGAHCEACEKSRKVSGYAIYGTGYYKDSNHICTLNVPCKEFVPKEENE